MRTKNFFITSAALLLLASCSSELDVTQTTKVDEPTPVTFGAYSAQSTKTRADVKIDDVADLADAGFGVFAYYTGTNDYNSTSSKPNFMYDEKVTGSGSPLSWTYSPLKYWPNDIAEDTAVDGHNATGSENGGKISFFAYAPHVECVYNTGVVTGASAGITAFTSNSAEGDPKVTYSVGTGDFQDLLWGTASSTISTITGTSQNPTDATGSYKVWKNIKRPGTGARIKFNFIHALSKFGGSVDGTNPGWVKIMLNPDEGESFGNGNDTKVTVSSIKIETPSDAAEGAKFYQSGKFNLATGEWTDKGDLNIIKQAVNKDGSSVDGYTVTTLNSDIVENEGFNKDSNWDNDLPNGVTKTAVDVYGSDTKPIYALPGTTPQLTVTIEYVVRTKDSKLAN